METDYRIKPTRTYTFQILPLASFIAIMQAVRGRRNETIINGTSWKYQTRFKGIYVMIPFYKCHPLVTLDMQSLESSDFILYNQKGKKSKPCPVIRFQLSKALSSSSTGFSFSGVGFTVTLNKNIKNALLTASTKLTIYHTTLWSSTSKELYSSQTPYSLTSCSLLLKLEGW